MCLLRDGVANALRLESKGSAAASVVGRRALGPKRDPQCRAATQTPTKQFVPGTTANYRFGKVEIFAGPSRRDDDLAYSFAPVVHTLEHKHPDRLRRLYTDSTAKCTADRANLVIDEIADEEFNATKIPHHIARKGWRLDPRLRQFP